MLRLTMGVHICVHNYHLYLSVVKYVEPFKRRYVLIANESSRMAVYSSRSFITLKLWSSAGVFLQGCLATSIHDEFDAHKSVFLITERTRWMLCPEDRGGGVSLN